MSGRVRLTNADRWFLIHLYRWFPSILKVLTIVRPETLVRRHHAGFRFYRVEALPQMTRIREQLSIYKRPNTVRPPVAQYQTQVL